MAIGTKTRVLVWVRGGGICAKCKRELVLSATEADDESLIGECAHIIAEQEDGPRGDQNVSIETRNSFSNLLLLCATCHKEVDDQVKTYPAEELKVLKKTHELDVAGRLDVLTKKRFDSLSIYASYVEEWARRADVDGWKRWTYGPRSNGQPSLDRKKYEELAALVEWLFTRIWPRSIPNLEDAFTNFRLVLADLLQVFRSHAKQQGDSYVTEKFYKIREWNLERYAKLSEEYVAHVELVDELTLELTRAANRICDEIRKHLDPIYRLNEGALLASSGPNWPNMQTDYHRAEYGLGTAEDRVGYPGLEQFKINIKS